MLDLLRRRNWSWLGHMLRRSDDSIARQALQWILQGHRIRGQLRTSGKRDLGKEIWIGGFRYSWRKMEVTAQDRAG